MFQNVPECIQNVPECSRMHAECSRIFLNVPGATRLTAWMSSCTGESRLDFVWWWMMTFLILVQNWGANLTLCISLPLHFIAIKELAVNNCCRAQIQVRSRSKSSEIDLSHTLFLVFTTTHPPTPQKLFSWFLRGLDMSDGPRMGWYDSSRVWGGQDFQVDAKAEIKWDYRGDISNSHLKGKSHLKVIWARP